MTGGAARQRTVAPSRGSCGYRGVCDNQCSVNDSYCGVCDICCDWSDIFCHSSHSICHQYRRKTPQLTEHNGTRPAPCDEPVTKPEGSDHTPPSSWTTHQRLPFNERMSITSLSGHHTTSLLATTQATAATTCPCLNIAAQGHERIITLAASSASIHGSIRETLATAHSIDWTQSSRPLSRPPAHHTQFAEHTRRRSTLHRPNRAHRTRLHTARRRMMGWQITSYIYGGHQLAPATQEDYRRVATALDDAGGKLTRTASPGGKQQWTSPATAPVCHSAQYYPATSQFP